MASKDTNHQKREKLALLWQFLKGAKRSFAVTVLAAGVTALADMLQPQIIRAAVDCALGGKEGDFPAFVCDFCICKSGNCQLQSRSTLSVSLLLPQS